MKPFAFSQLPLGFPSAVPSSSAARRTFVPAIPAAESMMTVRILHSGVKIGVIRDAIQKVLGTSPREKNNEFLIPLSQAQAVRAGIEEALRRNGVEDVKITATFPGIVFVSRAGDDDEEDQGDYAAGWRQQRKGGR
ncbi:hypothetical protein HZA43_05260 [Candidatus Peregrinibacteria bacterium]|nr:hypothetical protein [Candidatus Peregrinibacteria bacterium]